MSQFAYDSSYAERQLRRSRHPIRRFVKRFYLSNVLKDVHGPAIDFGCGAGQLLERLPVGSIGFEVNPDLVEALRDRGLDANQYDTATDQLCFSDVPEGRFTTFIMSHVLEHFDEAADGLRRILQSCERLGIKRVIVVVPGEKGYAFDATHKTFVNRAYLKENQLLHGAGYSVTSFSHFPVNWESVGNIFVFHELKIIYDRI